MSALSANLLFIGASDIGSVLSMISIDVIENLVLAIRVVYNVQRYKNLVLQTSNLQVEKDQIEHERRFREIEMRIKFMEKNMAEPIYSPLEKPRSIDTGIEADDKNEEEEDIEETEEKITVLKGEALVRMNRSLHLILQFFASEGSEIMSSLWALIMIPCIYASQNKMYFYTFDVLDKENFEIAILFCLADLILETATFTAMVVLIRITTGINVFKVLFAFVKFKRMFWGSLFILCCITIASFSFFVKHYGVDPEFKWEEFEGVSGAIATAT